MFAGRNSLTSTNWSTTSALVYGKVINPPRRAITVGAHAVCVTGFVPDDTEPKGGYFIFRNSWGVDWSSAAPDPANTYSPEPGYGQVSATYVDQYLWEMCSLG
jgi:hypothetical protein